MGFVIYAIFEKIVLPFWSQPHCHFRLTWDNCSLYFFIWARYPKSDCSPATGGTLLMRPILAILVLNSKSVKHYQQCVVINNQVFKKKIFIKFDKTCSSATAAVKQILLKWPVQIRRPRCVLSSVNPTFPHLRVVISFSGPTDEQLSAWWQQEQRSDLVQVMAAL